MDLEFGKFKILFINTFVILLKAATLNPYKLQTQLEDIDANLQNDCVLCYRVLVMFISLYLIIKFIMGYVTLAGNIIAMFPILAEDLPHLLLPAIFAQTLDHIALNLVEILLGIFTIKIISNEIISLSIFVIFLSNKFFKIILAITALNIYSDYYQQLKLKPLNLDYSSSSIESSEDIFHQQSFE